MARGTFIFGRLVGYSESAWASNGKQGVNRRLGVISRSYQDEFGQQVEETTSIDISQAMVPYVKEQVEKFSGKEISVQVVFQAQKGGKEGAFLKAFMPKESLIQLQRVEQKAADSK